MKSRRRSQFEFRCYAGVDLYERVLREAAARRLSVSECVRTDLAQYYAIRDELTECVHVDESQPGAEPSRRIMHTLLAEMETRFVAGMDRQASLFGESLQVVASMIERAYMGLMLHLPDVPLDQRDERLARARARLLAWRKQVQRRVGSGSPAIAALLDDVTSDESEGPGSAG